MKHAKINLAYLIIFIAFGCNEHSKNIANSVISATNSIEDFDDFNIRFHTDSIFQLTRIDFPIGGKSVDGFEKHDWTLNNWEMLRSPVVEKFKTADYEHSLIKSDTLVIEKIWIKNSGFEVERQFKTKNNKWFLTYYNDLNL